MYVLLWPRRIPAFRLGLDGVIKWREAIIARLVKGDNLYAPRAELVTSDLLSIDQIQRMNKRLLTFIATHIDAILGRLVALEAPDAAPVQKYETTAQNQSGGG